MRDLELGKLARAVRRRRGWRQEDCARRAGVHRSTWSRLERGEFGSLTVEMLRACLGVLEITLDLGARWRGPGGADRLLDEAHARLQAAIADLLRRWGWLVFVEVSFSHFGERGRVDLVAFDPRSGVLLIVEIKTDVVDAQGLLGPLDVKVRLARQIAAGLDLPTPTHVLPVLVVPDTPTIRRRVERLAPLFTRFTLTGRDASSALRRRDRAVLGAERGLLIFSNRSSAHGEHVKSVGRERVRHPRARASSDPGRDEAAEGAGPT
jgi:transcriptional regulator with XRE-family HTH domain